MLRNHPKALVVLSMLALLFTFFLQGGSAAAAHATGGSPTVLTVNPTIEREKSV